MMLPEERAELERERQMHRRLASADADYARSRGEDPMDILREDDEDEDEEF